MTHPAVRGHLGATILDSLGLLLLYSNSGTKCLKLGLSLNIQIVLSPFLVTFMIQQARQLVSGTLVSPIPGGFLDRSSNRSNKYCNVDIVMNVSHILKYLKKTVI